MVATLNTQEELILEQDGKAVMVVMPYQRYQQLMEYVEDLEDTIATLEVRQETESVISLEDYVVQYEQNKSYLTVQSS